MGTPQDVLLIAPENYEWLFPPCKEEETRRLLRCALVLVKNAGETVAVGMDKLFQAAHRASLTHRRLFGTIRFPRHVFASLSTDNHQSMGDFEQDVKTGSRFQFGRNWQHFLTTLDEITIAEAEKSLQEMLGVSRLEGLRFLDVGCGSGLFSLVARRLGADVMSFDYDPQSVACAESLKTRFFPGDAKWQIARGSALDAAYLSSLGTFDVVYSWGVLHHTGKMWEALANVCAPVNGRGRLFLAIYNDQGWLSRFWWGVKKTYCAGWFGKFLVCLFLIPCFAARALVKSVLTRTNVWADYKRKNRGMSLWHDWMDWLGGFPFEVASVEAIKKFYEERGFSLAKLKATTSLGNNEFVFVRN